MILLSYVAVGGATYALAWFTKDATLRLFKGASALAADLRVKAAKLEASLKSL